MVTLASQPPWSTGETRTEGGRGSLPASWRHGVHCYMELTPSCWSYKPAAVIESGQESLTGSSKAGAGLGLGLWLPVLTSSLERQGLSSWWGCAGLGMDTGPLPWGGRTRGAMACASHKQAQGLRPLTPRPEPLEAGPLLGPWSLGRHAHVARGLALCWHGVPPLMPQDAGVGGIQIFQNAEPVLDRAEPGRGRAWSGWQRLLGGPGLHRGWG